MAVFTIPEEINILSVAVPNVIAHHLTEQGYGTSGLTVHDKIWSRLIKLRKLAKDFSFIEVANSNLTHTPLLDLLLSCDMPFIACHMRNATEHSVFWYKLNHESEKEVQGYTTHMKPTHEESHNLLQHINTPFLSNEISKLEAQFKMLGSCPASLLEGRNLYDHSLAQYRST